MSGDRAFSPGNVPVDGGIEDFWISIIVQDQGARTAAIQFEGAVGPIFDQDLSQLLQGSSPAETNLASIHDDKD